VSRGEHIPASLSFASHVWRIVAQARGVEDVEVRSTPVTRPGMESGTESTDSGSCVAAATRLANMALNSLIGSFPLSDLVDNTDEGGGVRRAANSACSYPWVQKGAQHVEGAQ
jgi:hypothetical protein